MNILKLSNCYGADNFLGVICIRNPLDMKFSFKLVFSGLVLWLFSSAQKIHIDLLRKCIVMPG